MNKFAKDLTTGSVFGQLVRFAIPFFFSNLIQSVYSVADMMILGHYGGTNSLSAVNTSSQIALIVTNLAMGISTGGTVMIGQYLGAKQEERIRRTTGTLLVTLAVLSAVLSAVLLAVTDPMLRALNVPAEAFAEAKEYLVINLVGLIFVFAYNALSAIMRGMGDSRTPLAFVTIACIANIVLDFILVGALDMGAGGAAAATVASQALSAVLCVIYLRRNNFLFDFSPSSFRFDPESFRTLMKVGLPTGVQHVATNFSFLLLTGQINGIGGAAAGAATGIVNKFNGFAILPDIAVSSSVSAMISQCMGAKKEHRVKKAALYGAVICCVISAVIFALANLFPAQIFRLFGAEEDIIQVGTKYMRAFSFEYVFLPLIICFNSIFTGTGNGWITLITNVVSSFAVRIPLAYYLGEQLGVFGIGCSVPAATLAGGLIAFVFYLSGVWKKNAVIKENEQPVSD